MRTFHASQERSFELLVRDVLRPAYKHARYLTGDDAEAQDLLQEAVLHALRGFDTFRPGTNFRAWFLRVLINAFFMRVRKERRSARDVSLDAASSHLHARLGSLNEARRNAAQGFISKLTVRQIGDAILSLPPDYRVAATLYFLEDLSYQEIASILDCPLGTVRSRLHRGRKLLQVALRRIAEDHGIVGANGPGPGR